MAKKKNSANIEEKTAKKKNSAGTEENMTEKKNGAGKESTAKNQSGEEKEVNIVKEIVGMVVYVAFIIFMIWVIITFVGQRTVVSGPSMNDTLEDGDNLWISKISYRLHDPERFDIVVFPYQHDRDVYYIKRVIGLPGETVRIDEDGTIYIDGKVLDEDYGKETIEYDMIGRASEEIKLSDNEYFVMGDNRNDSKDSRFEEVGNIQREDMIGKAVFRMWPFGSFGTVK